MAWRCSGSTHAELVANLCSAKIITSDTVRRTMLAVDRGHFCSGRGSHAYVDAPQSISFGATISAPHVHAYALEYLKDFLVPGARALDVGSGSGYLTACFATMTGPTSHVVGIDHIPELVEQSRKNIEKSNKDLFVPEGRLKLVVGDGRKGWPEGGPYDAIHVGAACPGRPTALIEQLNTPGRLVSPVGMRDGVQYMMQYDKDKSGKVTEKELFGVIYIPLCDKAEQLSHY
ncbi:protein-L-isoaspartate O-methyltransferase-like protein [Ramicandelaber brevisporus]|nr:protein-L-isoaspartate O-methyltransferase-like protein [Ramicandelaber brevisporus]